MTRPVPRWIGALAVLGGLLIGVPLLGLLLRVPWSRVPVLLAGAAARDALALSLQTCLASTVLSLVLGLPVALVLSRLRGHWMAVGRVVATVPLVLPPVVAGLALLVTLGRRGLVGQVLSLGGIEIGFTTAAVVIAQTFVAMPFLVVAVEGALRSIDPDAELMAATLGAGPSRVAARRPAVGALRRTDRRVRHGRGRPGPAPQPVPGPPPRTQSDRRCGTRTGRSAGRRSGRARGQRRAADQGGRHVGAARSGGHRRPSRTSGGQSAQRLAGRGDRRRTAGRRRPAQLPGREPPLAVDLTLAAVAELGLTPSLAVWLSVKASQVLLYPR
ncbi:molybdate ABC transporter permease subunit [Micropruina sp.]|uniref:molybdate ABC transporter permease subunit n=1 Tax=Micropruina sp. TaxID=2737536 RepID=UPI0039E5AE65